MIIDVEKLKTCESIKIKLDDTYMDAFCKNANDYFTLVADNPSGISSVDCIDVLSALVYFREYFIDEAQWQSLILKMLEIIRTGVNRSSFDKIAVFAGMTHIAFTVRSLAKIAPRLRLFSKEVDEILLSNLNDFLSKSNSDKFYTEGNYEVIKGLSGPLRYLLDFSDDEKMTSMAKKIVDVFVRRSEDITIMGHHVPGWHYYPSEIEASFMTEKADNGVINYGVSHGMGGPLATLSLAYASGMRSEGLLNAINRLIKEFMDGAYYANNIVCWPGRIKLEQYATLEKIPIASRPMSWCYGSVGILRTMYLAGLHISDEKVKQFAIDEMLKIAKMELADYMLIQPIVCHGYVGTGSIFSQMYLDTGRQEFLEKTKKMIDATISYDISRFIENEKSVANSHNSPLKLNVHNHLEGFNGMMQMTLSILRQQPDENDKRLLMI